MEAVIIAGGLGTRARAMTGDLIPKALLPVDGVPIVFRQLRWLARESVTHVVILAGHLGEKLKDAVAPEAARLGLSLDLIVEDRPLGTAGCLSALTPMAETLIVYGDMLCDIDLSALGAFHERKKAVLTVVAHPNDHPTSSDLIVEHDDIAMAVLPRDKERDRYYRNLVPAGLYLAAPAFFAQLPRGKKGDMVHDILPSLIQQGERIGVYNTPEYLRDVGTVKRHALAEADLAADRVRLFNRRVKRPALFFDCDGVLNEEVGGTGVVSPGQIKPVPGAAAALKRSREHGYLNIVVTNRAQLAKGLITHADLAEILGRLEALLAEDGGVLDRIYYCPHHPHSGFPDEVRELKIRCECRKPGTLMLQQAVDELPVDASRSAMIGDSQGDIAAAKSFGLWAYGVRTGHGCRRQGQASNTCPPPDLMFSNVAEAVEFNLQYRDLAAPLLSLIELRARHPGRPLVVALCGRPRAGKSVAAHALARSLQESGQRVLQVTLDQWIMTVEERAPQASAVERNRVALYRHIFTALREREKIVAPGYDPETRGATAPVFYDSAEKDVVIVDGIFAAHETIRDLIDCAVFVEANIDVQKDRFGSFYRWKGLDPAAIANLWDQRSADEWQIVDAQRTGVNLVFRGGEEAA